MMLFVGISWGNSVTMKGKRPVSLSRKLKRLKKM